MRMLEPTASDTSMPPESWIVALNRAQLGAILVERGRAGEALPILEEAHARLGSDQPRLDIEEFEDASIEYGALLTREMMGLSLGKRDRRRKRELERLLLVERG